MRSVNFVIGRQGSGKTSICTNERRYILPGQLLRKKYGEDFFAKVSNPCAPEEVEQEIRKIITEAINLLPDGESLYVDGFPRKPSQVHWLKTISGLANFSPKVIFVSCSEKERITRLTCRDFHDDNKVKLVQAREVKESSDLLDVITTLHEYGIPYTVFPNNNIPMGKSYGPIDDTCEIVSPLTSLRKIFDLHESLLNIGGCKFPGSIYKTNEPVVAGSDRAKIIIEMFRKIKQECDELIEAIPDKSWPIPELKTDIATLRVESIDAFHFMLSGFMSLGMSADDVARIYDGKRRINIDRQTKGYLLTKGRENDSELGKC